MATRVIDDTKLNNIAFAIQNKDGGGQMTVDDMPDRISAIPTQDNTMLNSLIDRSVTRIESNVTSIGKSAFINCTQLRSAIFPNATVLNSDAIRNCPRLTTIEIPKATTVNGAAFFGDYALRRIFLRSVTKLNGAQIFWVNTSLTTVIMSKQATLNDVSSFTQNSAIIYVQSEDLEWYSTATNWSTLYSDNRIKSVEDLTGHDLAWYQEQLAKYPLEEE